MLQNIKISSETIEMVKSIDIEIIKLEIISHHEY